MVLWLAAYAIVVAGLLAVLLVVKPRWSIRACLLAITSPAPAAVALFGVVETGRLLLDPIAEHRLGPIGWTHVLQIFLIASGVIWIAGLAAGLIATALVRRLGL